jgi:hypothetical protein
MAVKTPTLTRHEPAQDMPKDQHVYVVKWVLADGDTATAVALPGFPDRSVSIFGTFGGATVALEATNDPDGVDGFMPALDLQGLPISATAGKFDAIGPIAIWIRPTIMGGAGASVTVALCMGRGRA